MIFLKFQDEYYCKCSYRKGLQFQFLNLKPLVLEFFDSPEKVEESLKKVKEFLDGGHIVQMDGEVF